MIICLISALIFVGGRVSAIRERKEEYLAVCSLLLHIRGKLASGGGALCEILRDFRSDILDKNGTLACLGANGALPPSAHGADSGFFRDKLSYVTFLHEREDSDKLASYFANFGRSYIDEERKKLDEVIGYFEKKAASVSERSEKDIKTTMILFAFFFVGAFILIL